MPTVPFRVPHLHFEEPIFIHLCAKRDISFQIFSFAIDFHSCVTSWNRTLVIVMFMAKTQINRWHFIKRFVSREI